MADSRPTSLVLGSGGARGHAHIGVIRAVTERGLDVRSISGTSMGAVIGGIYAADALEKYTDWALALSRTDVVRLLDFSFSGTSLFKGDRVFDVLRTLLGDCRIEALSRGYTAVATDIDAHREIWLNSGSLFDAMRASAAVPGILSPVVMDGRTLVDGGLVNPIPIAPTLNDATTLTIAVDLNGRSELHAEEATEPPAPAETDTERKADYGDRIRRFFADLVGADESTDTKPSAIRLMSDSLDIMQGAVSRLKFAAYAPDIVVTIPRNACSFFDFYKAEAMIELGYRRTVAALDAGEVG